MEENKKPSVSCCGGNGKLPGNCAPLAFPYVPMQECVNEAYDQQAGLDNGTLFPGLNLPFHTAMKRQGTLINTPLTELMALDFAIQELALYLDTHKDDQEALDMLQTYLQLAKEGRQKYEKRYGPLTINQVSSKSYNWSSNPWPWDGEGSDN